MLNRNFIFVKIITVLFITILYIGCFTKQDCRYKGDVFAQESVQEELPSYEDYDKKPENLNYVFQASPNGNLYNPYSISDAFVRSDYPNNNYGSWRMLTTAYFQDPASSAVINWGESFIKFDLAPINSQTIIQDATLEVWQYVRSVGGYGNYSINARKVTGDWSELGITWNNKPEYSSTVTGIGSGDCCYLDYRKFTFDVRPIVEEWVRNTANYGIKLDSSPSIRSGAICSRNTDTVCPAQYMPKLIVNFVNNSPPNVPNPLSPANGYETNNPLIQLKVNGIGDIDNNLDGTYFYFRQGYGSWVDSGNIAGTGTISFTKSFTDGIWSWKARSVDILSSWSEYSVEKTFIVDTVPPSQPELLDEPEFTPGTSNKITSTNSTDAGLGGVNYKFQISLDNFTTVFRDSGWGSSNEHTFISLSDDQKYYYRVIAKDKLNNQTAWSKVKFSTQDSTAPKITNFQTTYSRFSPNGDGLFDELTIMFRVEEKNLNAWSLNVKGQDGVIKRKFTGSELDNSILWDGKDSNGNIIIDGLYDIELKVEDKAGNTVSNKIEIIIDTLSPILNVSQPINNSWFNNETIKIAGITEDRASLKINGNDIDVEQGTGIFESDFNLGTLGINQFELESTDIVGNKNTVVLHVFKEINNPSVKFIEPSVLINNPKPVILAEFSDSGEENQVSGINTESIVLEMNEIVLVSQGQNLHPEIGEFSFETIDGTNYLFRYTFISGIGKDGDYIMNVEIKDRASNIMQALYNFELDTNTYLNLLCPVQDQLFNYSQIDIEGTAEINSQMQITNGIQSENLVIESADPSVFNCRDVDINFPEFSSWKEGKQICDFKIENFQLNKDTNDNIWVDNLLQFQIQDLAKNTLESSIIVKVNLFAVSLSIESSLDYFSPNGDGIQDYINFILNTDAIIDTWKIQIKNENNEDIKLINGQYVLPPNVIWDGKDEFGEWVGNGSYSYKLLIETSDGIEFNTTEMKVEAKSSVEGEVIITSPKNNYLTTRGVVLTQGIAPSESKVTVYYKPLGDQKDDAFYAQAVVDSDVIGNFGLVTALYSYEGDIFAIATDKYGNSTPRSNFVHVRLDFVDPFVSASLTPEIAGVNKPVKFESIVSQNTQRVEISFTKYSNLSELPGWNNIDWYDIGESGYDCGNLQCIWNLMWMTPEVKGGVYEIKLKAYKSEKVQEISLGLRIDGTIPVSPIVSEIRTQVSLETITKFEDKYFTNKNSLIVSGIAEPLIKVALFSDKEEILGELYSNAFGFWALEFSIPDEENNYFFYTQSFDLVNDGLKSEPFTIFLDLTAPKITLFDIKPDYIRSGSKTFVTVMSDEAASDATVIVKDGFEITLNQKSHFEFSDNFTIPPDTLEGDLILKGNLTDLAGNISGGEVSMIIDNSPPLSTSIDTYGWIKNRIAPGYVTKEQYVDIRGRAEKGTLVEFFVDSKLNQTITVSENNCSGSTLAYEGKTEKICDWNYQFHFPKDTQGRIIEKGYLFQARVIDLADNESKLSEEAVLYLDVTPPERPELDNWDYQAKRYINTSNVKFTGSGERGADVLIFLDKKIAYKSLISYQGIWEGFADIIDEGQHEIEIIVVDVAGNKSEPFIIKLIKDTIPPAAPLLKIDDFISERRVALQIQGETQSIAETRVYSNGGVLGSFDFNLGDKGYYHFYNALLNWDWGTDYFFEVRLKDLAGNLSNETLIKYNSGGTGQVIGTQDNTESYYNGRTGKDMDQIKAVAKVYPVEGSYKVDLDINLPVPIITKTETYSSNEVEAWVIYPQTGTIDIEFYRYQNSTIKDIAKECWWKMIIVPWGTYCTIDESNDYDYVLENKLTDQIFDPQNMSLLIFRERNSKVETIFNNERLKVNGKEYNDKGRWNRKFMPQTYLPGDKMFVELKISGNLSINGVNIDFEKISNESLRKIIGERPNEFAPVSPVKECNNPYLTQGFSSSHPAIDISDHDTCWITAVENGTVLFAKEITKEKVGFSGCGNGVFMQHIDGYRSLYCHGDSNLMNFEVNDGDKIYKGTYMFPMGCTGSCGGKHLHLSFSQFDKPFDPLTLIQI